MVIYDLSYISNLYLYHLQVSYKLTIRDHQLPDGLISQLVEQVSHGFESRSSLTQFFQAIILQLLKLCV